MKKNKYVLTTVTLLIIVLILSSCTFSTNKRHLYEYHRELFGAEDFLPSGFENYDNVEYNHKKKILFFFVTDTMTVKVRYDDLYITKKNEIEQTYKFLSEPVETEGILEGQGHYDIPVTEFEYNGFHMRVADGGEYPKKFGIVGYNDNTKEIVYLWFNDPDIDFISEPGEDKEQAMIDFVDNNFKLN